MFKKISVIGCGLIGSSILRAVEEKKLASKISAYDKSSKVVDYLKKNFIENVAYYCLESFNIAKDMDRYNSNITAKKKKHNKKRGRSNNSS